MKMNPIMVTDAQLFGAMLLEAQVSIWKKRPDEVSELIEYGVRMDKYTPDYVRVRYPDGACAYFRRDEHDFVIHNRRAGRDN